MSVGSGIYESHTNPTPPPQPLQPSPASSLRGRCLSGSSTFYQPAQIELAVCKHIMLLDETAVSREKQRQPGYVVTTTYHDDRVESARYFLRTTRHILFTL